MRAMVLDGSVKFRSDYRAPEPQPGEALVRVRIAGICGTDLELACGYMGFRGVPGHEFVGAVATAGSPFFGKRVVGEINAACGRCEFCHIGLGRHCPNRTVLGILGRDGAFAEFLTLPHENLHTVPDNVPDDVAVFAEPLAAAFEIFEQVALPRDSRIAVLGDGRLGAIVALALRAEGFSPVIGGHHGEKLARLSAIGVTAQMENELKSGFDVVVDCTGSSTGLGRAMELVRPRGTIILKSTAAGADNLNLAPVVINEVTVVGSRCGRFGPALDALVFGKVDPRPLISEVFPLNEGLRALEHARDPSNFKVLLKVC